MHQINNEKDNQQIDWEREKYYNLERPINWDKEYQVPLASEFTGVSPKF